MKRKILSLVMVIATVFSLSVVASATASKPYGTYYADIRETYGGACITACSCAPVDNYLSCSVRLQYLNNGTYKWTSWTSASGSNTNQKDRSWTVTSPDTAKYTDAKFEARCGTGRIMNYTANASR